jgi:IS5 family transposase
LRSPGNYTNTWDAGQQFGFQKTRLRGLAKNRCKIHVMAALSNLFQARRQLLATA